jgi:hypothetical protein
MITALLAVIVLILLIGTAPILSVAMSFCCFIATCLVVESEMTLPKYSSSGPTVGNPMVKRRPARTTADGLNR